MKHLLKSLNPKHLLKKPRTSSLSKSAPPSFSSTTSSISSSAADAAVDDELLRFDYVQAFKMIDRDGDGKITPLELHSLLRRVAKEEEVVAMICEIDRDGDGCISLDELSTVGSIFESTAEVDEEELREAFEFFDADHDGRISAEELMTVFVALGDERCTLEECRRMIEGVDKDGDGFVCFQDFTRMMDLQR